MLFFKKILSQPIKDRYKTLSYDVVVVGVGHRNLYSHGIQHALIDQSNLDIFERAVRSIPLMHPLKLQ